MWRIEKRSRKFTFLVIFFVTFFLLLNGLAVAGGEGGQGTSQESGQGSSQDARGSNPEAVHGAGDEGGHGADRSADVRDLYYRIINFTLLVIILFVVIKKSGLKESLTRRIDEIRQRLEDLKREREEAENKYQGIENKLREFEGERTEILEQFQREGLAEKEKIIAEAKKRAKQIVEQAELSIQQEMQSAKDRLKQAVVDRAAQKAQELIAKEMTEEDQDRLVEEFIERVGKIN